MNNSPKTVNSPKGELTPFRYFRDSRDPYLSLTASIGGDSRLAYGAGFGLSPQLGIGA